MAVQWYKGDVTTRETDVKTVRVEWKCPNTDCLGTMEFTGEMWMTNPTGNFHVCTHCKNALAIKNHKYPEIRYI